MTSPLRKEKVLVAMSGGVDSSVAAYLLQQQGYDVIGATIKTWAKDECRDEKAKGCCSLRDVQDARRVAATLDIPYYVLDLSVDFKEKVIHQFIESYLAAQTPNPCIQCNIHIKFGIFLKKAEELGCSHIATGHYARRVWDDDEKCWLIQEGRDLGKDQSYVLFGLDQKKLSKTLLPVGDYEKKEIRQIAEKLGMIVHDKPDSQEICFIPTHYSEFIQGQGIDLPGKGELFNLKGEMIGEHEGYHHYTIGQRKGIGVSDETPNYVVDIDRRLNRVIVGKKDDVKTTKLTIRSMNWLKKPKIGDYYVKIRSRHLKQKARLTRFSQTEAHAEFYAPEDAITPGQAAVFYEGDTIAGGGWIVKQPALCPENSVPLS
jgi:tRNA-specific 2-thiouridylase